MISFGHFLSLVVATVFGWVGGIVSMGGFGMRKARRRAREHNELKTRDL